MDSNRLPQLEDLAVEGKRVIVRCDLNVPLEDGAISDDLRIRASVPTLRKLLDRGARLAVCSHLGRPKGRVVEELRLSHVGERLGELLDEQVNSLQEVVGDAATKACRSDDPVVLLENLRFEPGEEANDPSFADALSELGECFVNDAFGSSHRAHASVVGLPERLPSAAGFLLADELTKLDRLLNDAEHPFVAVLGGAKVSDKLGVIGNLIDRVDTIVVGGAMAFTLLAATDQPVGNSLVERDRLQEVRGVLNRARDSGVSIELPRDVVAADAPDETSKHGAVSLQEIGDRMGVDIGPATSKRFAELISTARSILWNGPMGIFEIPAFAGGTRVVARAVVVATESGAYSVVGGGDSAAALKELGLENAVSHLSTGGGASLEFLEGKDLPGIAALRKGSQ
jgi:phosphoglycerate kinase